jgi:putative DNA primase/helicase
VTLKAIVAALGGDLYARGLRANVPAPGHNCRDRSVSLLLSRGRVVVHSFGGAHWREVLDDLRSRGLVDAWGAPAGGGAGAPSPDPTQPERSAAARALWSEAVPVQPGSAAARHLRRRAAEAAALSPALRSHPDAPLSIYRPGVARRPALLAAVTNAAGALTAVEVTYLDPNGRRACGVRVARKTAGLIPAGSAVRLHPPGPELLVAEGVFSAWSAGERFGLPAWALLSTTNLRRWTAPTEVRRVLLAGDPGPDGERSARRLLARLRRDGVRTDWVLPPPDQGDWNDLARVVGAGGRDGKGARSRGASPAGSEPERPP